MQMIYRLLLSLLIALQLSLASAVPSWAHLGGELAGCAAGAASIKTVTSADASKYGLQKSSGSNTLYDEATGINYAVGKDGLIYEVSSLSGFNPIPLSKSLTSATNRGLLNIIAANPSASERAASDHMAGLGRNVELRDPVGTRAGGGTSDLLIDGVSGPTQGVVDTPDGPVYLQSGVNGPASGYNNPDLPAVNQASPHVEGHAAALMNQNGITDMTVTINNVGGPCGNCLSQVPDMLPTGSTLNVRWMDADGALQVTTIPGRAN